MLPRPRLTRLLRCLLGLVMLGVGLGLTVAADLGLSPWDVLHQGLSERLDISIGTASIGVGVVVARAEGSRRMALSTGRL